MPWLPSVSNDNSHSELKSASADLFQPEANEAPGVIIHALTGDRSVSLESPVNLSTEQLTRVESLNFLPRLSNRSAINKQSSMLSFCSNAVLACPKPSSLRPLNLFFVYYFPLFFAIAMSTVGTANTDPSILDDDDEKALATQDISGRNINQTKLTTLLRMKFGVGAYDIHVSCSQVSENFGNSTGIRTNICLQIMHNTYCIKAPRKLSLVS